MTRLLIGLVRFYQKFISPLFPPSCRYRPTCSAYMIEALQKHGLKGFLMGLARIGRCHPLVEGGEDPVPDRFSLKRNKQKQGNLLFVLYKYRFLGCLQYSLKRFGSLLRLEIGRSKFASILTVHWTVKANQSLRSDVDTNSEKQGWSFCPASMIFYENLKKMGQNS